MTNPEQKFDVDDRQSVETANAAKAAFQVWVDDIGVAFRNNDFETYNRSVSMPLMVKTDGAAMRVNDRESLRESFDGWARLISEAKIDRTVHDIIDAVWNSETQMTGIFDTTFYAGDAQVMPTFKSLWEVELCDGVWCVTTIVNGMKNITWPLKSPIFVPDKDGKA